MRKRYFFIPLIVIIVIAGVLVWACKHPTGTGIPEIANESSGEDGGEEFMGPQALMGSGGGIKLGDGYVLPQNSLSQEEQDEEYDPDFNNTILFSGRNIPALTVTSNGVILATAGTTSGPITIKRSSDMGKTWFETTVNGTTSGIGYIHPFFINCHNGDILLGVVSNNAGSKTTIIYRGKNDGQTWNVATNISFSEICKDTKECFVTYGQGITLRHGNNGNNKLMFPYWYTNNKDEMWTAPILSSDDGKTFNTNDCNFNKGKVIGKFTSYETKLIELANRDILLNVRSQFGDGGNTVTWIKSTDCGKNWPWSGDIFNNGKDANEDAKHADLVRYEFSGKDIKNNGSKYALAIYSSMGSGYSVRMTTNDFNNGLTGDKYPYNRKFAEESGNEDGYPAITVLPDGTIATLTEENNSDIVFRRFNLSWLTYKEEKINYSIDLKNNNN